MWSKHFLFKKRRVESVVVWYDVAVLLILLADWTSLLMVFIWVICYCIWGQVLDTQKSIIVFFSQFDQAYSFSVKTNQSTDIATFWYHQALVSKAKCVHPRGCAIQSFGVQESKFFVNKQFLNIFKSYFNVYFAICCLRLY